MLYNLTDYSVLSSIFKNWFHKPHRNGRKERNDSQDGKTGILTITFFSIHCIFQSVQFIFSKERFFMQRTLLTAVLLSVSLILFCGCPASKVEAPKTSPVSSAESKPVRSGHSHDFGPNGGSLAVMGAHQFHAEAIANEETGDVEIRIYTGSNKPTTLEAKEIKLNRTIEGKPKQYDLPAVEGGDTATFKINDKELAEAVNDRKWEGALQVALLVDGVPCNGVMSKKKHEGDDHGHEH
ncbi:MAG: hypothetical protein FWE67_05475 [Planctomycetaceae bacterium]|nr:hypothetical protein [Planctomycetaceae bacterium]